MTLLKTVSIYTHLFPLQNYECFHGQSLHHWAKKTSWNEFLGNGMK